MGESTLRHHEPYKHTPRFSFLSSSVCAEYLANMKATVDIYKEIRLEDIYVPERMNTFTDVPDISIGAYYTRFKRFKTRITVVPYGDKYILIDNYETLYVADRVFKHDTILAIVKEER